MASPASTPHAQPADQLDNRRTIAATIDCGPFVIAGAALFGAGLLTPATGLMVLAWMAYYAFAFESGGAQTLGKRVMKLKTVDADGNPPTMRQAGIRNALRIVDLPLVGLFAMIASGDQRQRLGDRAAGTYVVEAGAPVPGDQAVTRQMATLAPGHVPEPAPARKAKRKSLGGPEIKLPSFKRKPKAEKPAAPVATATPAPTAAKAKRKSLGGPEIKLPSFKRKQKVDRPQGAKPGRKTLGGSEIKLPSLRRRKQAEAGPEVFAPDEPAVAPEPVVASEPVEPPAPAVPDIPITSAPSDPVAHEPEPAPVIEPDPLPEVSFDREPEITIDREPDVSFEGEPEIVMDREPEITFDREPDVSFDREPDVSFADEPQPDIEDPTIEVKPIETVSAIDLVMQDADQNHRPGA